MTLYLYALCMIFITYIGNSKEASLNSNENECLRIRRPWHELSESERDLYISGILQLRKLGHGDIMHDEFISIASVHEDEFAPVTHKASSYLFWHGYLTWELETRIRNLGGKYGCFGMPYWDFTIEAGRESNPWIFSTGLGGNGNVNDYFTVNEYTWKYNTNDYWVPFNCIAENDKYPICSLKRALKEGFQMQTAQFLGDGIIKHKQFAQFAKWYANTNNPVHLFTDSAILQSPNAVTTSYDPIWYLFHSMVQYHQAIWTDCNDYDLIDINELDNYPEAYKAFCIHGECVEPNKYPAEWMQFKLDDIMHFGGTLKQQEWSYINKNDLTVRKLYDVSKWGIVYDLGNGDGFYTKSGLKDYCSGKLNDKWFILNEQDQQGKILAASSSSSSSYMITYYLSSHNSIFMIMFALVISIGYFLRKFMVCKKQKNDINGEAYDSYGSV